MQLQRTLAGLMLVAIALAGCLSDSDDDGNDGPGTMDGRPTVAKNFDDEGKPLQSSGRIAVAPDQSLFFDTVVNDHATEATGHIGHQLPELHAHDIGFELIDHNDLSSELLGPGSGYIEVHVSGDLAVVASAFGSRGATIVDISDPTNLVVLSHIYNLDDNWDSRLSDDGRYLFLGCQGTGAFDCTTIITEGEESPSTEGGGPCVPAAGCPGGIAVFDLLEPRNPIFIDYLPMGGTHNVFSFLHDNGNYYVMNEDVTIAEWNPEDRTFQIVSQGDMPGTHDVDIQKHPITGEWLAYTGSQNMSIWNLDNPAEPYLVGYVSGDGPNAGVPPTWHEQTPMPCLIDGRHITIGAGESGGGIAQPVAILDTTDPTFPRYLGQWQLPDAPDLTAQQSYRFSLHNIDGNCDGQVAIGHYHAGVWVFDISTVERMENPVNLGYYMPHERSISPGYNPVNAVPLGLFLSADQPNVWTAQWSEDGQTLFVPDMATGLYALAPTWEYE